METVSPVPAPVIRLACTSDGICFEVETHSPEQEREMDEFMSKLGLCTAPTDKQTRAAWSAIKRARRKRV